jgi:hydrogenase expression/formation protein HypE
VHCRTRAADDTAAMPDPAPVPLPAGKLPHRSLREMLDAIPQRDPRVIQGPRIGEDAAVIDLGHDTCLVVTTDPITFATDRIGWYAVHVNANDVAVMGARPRWFFTVLLLPAGVSTESDAAAIMSDIAGTCEALGITVCGGHTEWTTGLDRPIVVGQMMGETPRSRLVTKAGLRSGDRILLTQGVAIEGTAIAARELGARLSGRLPEGMLERAERFLFEPGISVVEAALSAADTGLVHAMHDPTEGGVLTGLYELAAAGALGLRADTRRVHVFPETRGICDELGADPFALVASGALLVAVAPEDEKAVTEAIERVGVAACPIADVLPASDGLSIVDAAGVARPLVVPARDEMARLLEG